MIEKIAKKAKDGLVRQVNEHPNRVLFVAAMDAAFITGAEFGRKQGSKKNLVGLEALRNVEGEMTVLASLKSGKTIIYEP